MADIEETTKNSDAPDSASDPQDNPGAENVTQGTSPMETLPVHVPKPEPTFQERLDGARDSFRATRQAHVNSMSTVVDAKAEMDKTKVAYDNAMSNAGHYRREHLQDTRDLIRVLQEHEVNLLAEPVA